MPIKIWFLAQFCLLRDVGDFGFSSRLRHFLLHLPRWRPFFKLLLCYLQSREKRSSLRELFVVAFKERFRWFLPSFLDPTDGWLVRAGIRILFLRKKNLCPRFRKIILFDWYFSGQENWLLPKSSYENLVNLIIASDKMPPIREAGLMQLGTSVSSRSQDSLFESGDFPVQARHSQTTALLCWVSISGISGLHCEHIFRVIFNDQPAEVTPFPPKCPLSNCRGWPTIQGKRS